MQIFGGTENFKLQKTKIYNSCVRNMNRMSLKTGGGKNYNLTGAGEERGAREGEIKKIKLKDIVHVLFGFHV
jgi:hypothetical protein